MRGHCARGEHCAQSVISNDPQYCDCACHTGPYAACTVPGGCGHLHQDVLVGAPIESAEGLCSVCVMVVTEALSELPSDYVSLRVAQLRGLAPGLGELVTSSKELPLPISLTFATLADQIEVEVTAFVEPVAERLNIDWDKSSAPKRASRYGLPPRYSGPVVLDKAAYLLANSVDILVSLPLWTYRLWGDDGWIEIDATGSEAALILLSLHQTARSVLGFTRAITTLQAECPHCHTSTLVRIAGQGSIKCQMCLRRFSDKEYEQWSLVLINEHPKPRRRRRKRPKDDRLLHHSAQGTVGRPLREEVS